MSEGHLRLVALSVLGGPLHGRRHNPEEVVAEILIGSDPDCHLVLELPGISPIHAKLWADLNEATVYDTSAPRGVYVNTTRVEDKAAVVEGDVLWLGPPQEPDSVCVKLQFEPWVEVLPGMSAGSEGKRGERGERGGRRRGAGDAESPSRSLPTRSRPRPRRSRRPWPRSWKTRWRRKRRP